MLLRSHVAGPAAEEHSMCTERQTNVCRYGHIHILQRFWNHVSFPKLGHLQFRGQEWYPLLGCALGETQITVLSTAGDCSLVGDNVVSLGGAPERCTCRFLPSWNSDPRHPRNLIHPQAIPIGHKLTPWSPADTVFSTWIKGFKVFKYSSQVKTVISSWCPLSSSITAL